MAFLCTARRQLALLALLALAIAPAYRVFAADPLPTPQEVLKAAGPLMTPQELPSYYQLLNDWGSALSRATNAALRARLGPDAPKLPFTWHITNDPNVNGYFALAQGSNGPEATIVVTRGLFVEAFADAHGDPHDAQKLEQAAKRVLGLFQHEFAHALDELDSNGIQRIHGKSDGTSIERRLSRHFNSQAVELATDYAAGDLAYRAGQPRDAIVEAQQFIESFSEKNSGWAKDLASEFLSTHPHGLVRSSAGRVALAGRRMSRGIPTGPELALPDGLERDYEIARQGVVKFKKFGSITEVLTELQSLKAPESLKGGEALSKYKGENQLAFAHARKSLEELIFKAGSAVTDSEKGEIIRFYHDLRQQSSRYPYIDQVVKQFDAAKHGSFPRGHPGHDLHPQSTDRLLGDSELFNQTDFRQQLREAFKTDFIDDNYRKLFGQRVTNAYWSQELTKKLTNSLRSGQSVSPEKDLHWSEFSNDEGSRWYWENLHPLLTDQERLKLHSGTKVLDVSQHSILYRWQFEKRPPGPGIEELYFGKNPSAPDQVRKHLIEQAQEFWSHRGKYGVLDHLGRSQIEWPWVWRFLGIDPAQGRIELNQAIREFTSGQEYVQLLKTFPSGSLLALSPDRAATVGDLAQLQDNDLYPYLRGEHNPYLRSANLTADQQVLMRRQIAGSYLLRKPKVLKAELVTRLKRRALQPKDARGVAEAMDQELAAIFDFKDTYALNSAASFAHPLTREVYEDAFLEWTSGHPERNRLLREAFITRKSLNSPYQDFGELWRRSPESFRKITDAMIQAKTLPRRYTYFQEQNVFAFEIDWKNKHRITPRNLIRAMEPSIDILKQELATLPAEELDSFFRAVFEPMSRIDTSEVRSIANDFTTDRDLLAKRSWDELKGTFLSRVERSGLPPARQLEMVTRVAGSGPSRETDRYLASMVFPQLRRIDRVARREALAELVRTGAIWDKNREFQLVHSFLEAEAKLILGKPPTPTQIEELGKWIREVIPAASKSKDAFLESLTWKYEINTLDELRAIERMKSTHVANLDPQIANVASAWSEVLERLHGSEVTELLEYMIDPGTHRFPEPILKRIHGELDQEGLQEAMKLEGILRTEAIEKSKAATARFIRVTHDGLERAVNTVPREERVLLYEMLMHAGPEPMATKPDFARSFARKYLRYSADSHDEIRLLATLKQLRKDEVPAVLAYLLGHSGEGGADLEKILPMFGTPGKKWAQVMALWDVVPEQTERLKRTKDAAGSMTKLEFLSRLQEELSPADFSKIKKVESILGSASIKTVGKIMLDDGSSLVASVVDPNAESQIRAHFKLARDVFHELGTSGLPGTGNASRRAIDLAEHQALAELDMIEEGKKIAVAREATARVSQSMKSELGRFRLNVPAISPKLGSYRNVLFTELAPGSTFNRLRSGSKELAEAEPLVADALIRLYFREGLVISDPHRGNILLETADADAPVIHFIDHGQNVELIRNSAVRASDDVAKLSDFLIALRGKNSKNVLKAGLAMSGGTLSVSARNGIEKEISEALALKETPPDKLILRITQAFAEAGAPLEDRFAFNTLKEFSTIIQEKYVTPQQFEALVTREVTQGVKQSVFRSLLDPCSTSKVTNLLKSLIAPAKIP